MKPEEMRHMISLNTPDGIQTFYTPPKVYRAFEKIGKHFLHKKRTAYLLGLSVPGIVYTLQLLYHKELLSEDTVNNIQNYIGE